MARRKKGLPITGWLNLNKPLGMTSTAAVGKARWLLAARKVGHGGTLDPLATGVLPLAFGEATKVLPYLVDASKTYTFTVAWGVATTTDDREGEVVARSDVRPSQQQIDAILPDFVGVLSQRPPAYSAIKVDGERAYDLARAGETVELEKRDVRINTLRLLDARADEADFEVDCGKGTYVRSLARDIAEALGTVGHVAALCRTRVGVFSIENAITLEKVEELGHTPDLLHPLETVLDDIPALAIMEGEARRIKHGQAIAHAGVPDGERLLLFQKQALAIAHVEQGHIRPIRVFNIDPID